MFQLREEGTYGIAYMFQLREEGTYGIAYMFHHRLPIRLFNPCSKCGQYHWRVRKSYSNVRRITKAPQAISKDEHFDLETKYPEAACNLAI
jgi:hypothetical protein